MKANEGCIVNTIRNFLVIFITLGITYNVKADIPTITIIGADSPIDAGELIVLNAKVENEPENLSSVIYKWKILEACGKEKTFIEWPGSKQIVFSAGIKSKSYFVILVAHFLFVDHEGEIVTNVQHASSKIIIKNIKVEGWQPPPPPTNPNPNPPREPVPPQPPMPEPNNLSGLTHKWIIESDFSGLNIQQKKDSAKALEESFLSVAQLIDQEILNDPLPILDITGIQNIQALENIGIDSESWADWSEKFQNHIYGMYEQKQLPSAKDYAKVWREVATGLQQYYNSLQNSKWNKNILSYKIKGWLDEDMSTIEQRSLVRQAWNSWEKVCNIHVYETNSNKADIIIDIGRIDGPNGYLAWATLPGYDDKQLLVKFDENEKWLINKNSVNRGIIFHNVAAHEFGHILGLRHSRYSSALMSPSYNPRIPTPQERDDIPRIQNLYGPPEKTVLDKNDFQVV